jgi:hypothetical protein
MRVRLRNIGADPVAAVVTWDGPGAAHGEDPAAGPCPAAKSWHEAGTTGRDPRGATRDQPLCALAAALPRAALLAFLVYRTGSGFQIFHVLIRVMEAC